VTTDAVPRLRIRPWVPQVAGALCFLLGLMNVASAVTPAFRGRFGALTPYIPGALTNAALAATLVAGILLLLLAKALRRRKRRAWRAVVALLAVSVVLHVVKGFYLSEALITCLMLVALIVYRHEFYALGDPRTRWRALAVFVLLAAVDTVLGLVIVSVRPRDLVGSPGLEARLEHVWDGLLGMNGPLQFSSDRVADLVTFSLLGLGLLTVVTTAYLVLRPPEPRAQLEPEDEARMRDLLDRWGSRDSLGYFALRRDKSVLWSPTGKSCIAYRVVSGVMLASGDPLGDYEAWPGAIKRFREEAERHAWVPAVMGCSELGGEVWTREADLDALEIGDEAVVEVAEFTLEGRAMRNVRQMVNRIERQGYSCEVRRLRDISIEDRALAAEQAAAWRGTETERGFSMALGRLGDPQDENCVIVMAKRDGVLRAFLHFVPWGRDGLSLDLMRRDRTADPGLNELLIVAALRAAPSLGVRRVSLNFAVFRSALERGERLGAGPVLRAWRAVLIFASRWFQIESLYRFNAKFRPVWEPRYLVYPQTRDIPRIAIAALEAEAFLVMPKPSTWWWRAKARKVVHAPPMPAPSCAAGAGAGAGAEGGEQGVPAPARRAKLARAARVSGAGVRGGQGPRVPLGLRHDEDGPPE
jgi:lysyl-tRNA synthetase, class II